MKTHPNMAEPSHGKGLRAWSEGLREQHAKLKASLEQPREVGQEAVQILDLPHYRRNLLIADSFLSDPESGFASLETTRFFILLQNRDGKVVRDLNATKKGVMAFVRRHAKKNPHEWSVNVAEFLEQVYGGNISVSKEGAARIEFRKGEQGPVSAGTASAHELYHAWQDPNTRVWKYDFDDAELRALVQRVVHDVPHDERDYLPGLYEFQLVDPEGDGILEPRFVDYRSDLH